MAHIPKATTAKEAKAGLAAKSADGRRPWPANHHAIRPSNNRNGSNIGRQLKKSKKTRCNPLLFPPFNVSLLTNTY